MRLNTMLKKFLLLPFRLQRVGPYIFDGARVLDLGCANGSPTTTKEFYPSIYYVGVDLRAPTSPADLKNCDELKILDLDTITGREFAANSFDVVLMSHVIEHLHEPLNVLRCAASWVKPGGVLYVETPGEKSLTLPSMSGTLNFYDDATHLELYDVRLIKDQLGDTWKQISGGYRRQLRRVVLLPFYLARGIALKLDKGPILWDVTHFAWYSLLRRI
jgi:SAM-dependent methyltransferase